MARKDKDIILNLDKVSTQEILDLQSRSSAWFEQHIRSLASKRGSWVAQRRNPNKLMSMDKTTSSVRPGNMYGFFYDPKTKKTLPYYDKFPLVLPWKKAPGGFIGLNLHYLPYNLRIQLLAGLMKFATNDNMDETTRLNFTWDAINKAGKTKAAKPCVKRYLASHVKSQFAVVSADDWAKVALLPIERFVGAHIMKIWRDSRSKM